METRRDAKLPGDFLPQLRNKVKTFAERIAKQSPLNDQEIFAKFLNHSNEILKQHYLQQDTGNLVLYISDAENLRQVIEKEYRRSNPGAAKVAVNLVKVYVASKLSVTTSSILTPLMKVINQSTGYEINTDAERDYIYLMIWYFEFFIKGKKPTFQLNILNLAINNYGHGIEKFINICDQKIKDYEERKKAALKEQKIKTATQTSGLPPLLTVVERVVIPAIPPASLPKTCGVSTPEGKNSQPPAPKVEIKKESNDLSAQALFALRKLTIIQIIDHYIEKTSFYQFHGKNRAEELKLDLNCSQNEKEFDEHLNRFLDTGTTSCDLGFWGNFFNCSGKGGYSLRGMLLEAAKTDYTIAFLKQRSDIIHVIDAYINNAGIHRTSGKKRAVELKNDILACREFNALKKRVDAFIKKGKTRSDYNSNSFCGIFKPCSGTSENSLRGMLEDFCSGLANRNFPKVWAVDKMKTTPNLTTRAR